MDARLNLAVELYSHGLRERVARRWPQAPKPVNKRVWASVEQTVTEVLDECFAEAKRRDPDADRPWVMLVDEYLWDAAWCLYQEGDPAAEQAVLRLRALHMSGDWNAYRAFHKSQERLRNYPEWPDRQRLVA